jgi:hypothetical protein
MAAITEQLGDDELLYRRIPSHPDYYDQQVDPNKPSDLAFRPTDSDRTGLSLVRAKYISAAAASWNMRKQRSDFVGVLRVGDLRKAGIEVRIDNPDVPHHVELPALRVEKRKESPVIETAHRLAKELCLRVEGPFPLFSGPSEQIL